MQIESFLRHAIELLQSSFGERPETFDSIDANTSDGKNIVRMVDPKMFAVTNVNRSVIAAPTIRMNDRIETDFAANNSLQRFLRCVRDDLGINFSVSFVNSKNDLFTAASATAFASDATSAEIRLVNFYFASGKRRSSFGLFGNASSDFQINTINRLMRYLSQQRRLLSSRIKCIILDNLPGFSLANF